MVRTANPLCKLLRSRTYAEVPRGNVDAPSATFDGSGALSAQGGSVQPMFVWQGMTNGRTVSVEVGSTPWRRTARLLIDGKPVAESAGKSLIAEINSHGAAVPLVATLHASVPLLRHAANQCHLTCGEDVVDLEVLRAPWLSMRSASERVAVVLSLLAGILVIESLVPRLSTPGLSMALPALSAAALWKVPYRAPDAGHAGRRTSRRI
jgi:hypothetical protein